MVVLLISIDVLVGTCWCVCFFKHTLYTLHSLLVWKDCKNTCVKWVSCNSRGSLPALRCSCSDWGQTVRLWQWGQLCPCWISSIDEHDELDEAVKLRWFSGRLEAAFFFEFACFVMVRILWRQNFNFLSTPFFRIRMMHEWWAPQNVDDLSICGTMWGRMHLDPEKFQPFFEYPRFFKNKKNPGPVMSVSWFCYLVKGMIYIFWWESIPWNFSATRSWGFDHQKETWEALPPMLSRRVGAAANTSVPGIPVSPINHVAWVFKLRQLLWQDVSMFVVVGMVASFGLKKWWNSSFTPGTWKSQTESGLFWKWQTSAGFF